MCVFLFWNGRSLNKHSVNIINVFLGYTEVTKEWYYACFILISVNGLNVERIQKQTPPKANQTLISFFEVSIHVLFGTECSALLQETV